MNDYHTQAIVIKSNGRTGKGIRTKSNPPIMALQGYYNSKDIHAVMETMGNMP